MKYESGVCRDLGTIFNINRQHLSKGPVQKKTNNPNKLSSCIVAEGPRSEGIWYYGNYRAVAHVLCSESTYTLSFISYLENMLLQLWS